MKVSKTEAFRVRYAGEIAKVLIQVNEWEKEYEKYKQDKKKEIMKLVGKVGE